MSAPRKTERTRNPLFQKEKPRLGDDLSFAAAEAYKLLRTNVLFALPDEQKCRLVGVTSTCSGEGKSTLALNLAYMLASAGERVLVIEADMRIPTIAKQLGVNPSPGLSNLLAGLCTVGEAIQSSGLHNQLWVLTSGGIPPNPSELLGSRSMRNSLDALNKAFDFILLDLPPVTEVADALVISKLADGMIMVVRQDYTNRRAFNAAMNQLRYVQAKILGFVITWGDYTKNGGKHKQGYGYYAESAKKGRP